MFELSLKQLKPLFIDRRKVVSEADRFWRRAAVRVGGYMRRAARSRVRRRKRVSKPGQGPTSWTGLLKQNIFFAFDPRTRTVVAGPVKLNRGSNAPRLLEYGGRTTLEREVDGRKVTVSAYYRPRPYMRPAMEKTEEKLPTLLRQLASR